MLTSTILSLGVLAMAGSASAQDASSRPGTAPTEATAPAQTAEKSRTIGIVLFEGFETLDVYGPVQMWGRLSDHRVVFVAETAGPVRSAQGVDAEIGRAHV